MRRTSQSQPRHGCLKLGYTIPSTDSSSSSSWIFLDYPDEIAVGRYIYLPWLSGLVLLGKKLPHGEKRLGLERKGLGLQRCHHGAACHCCHDWLSFDVTVEEATYSPRKQFKRNQKLHFDGDGISRCQWTSACGWKISSKAAEKPQVLKFLQGLKWSRPGKDTQYRCKRYNPKLEHRPEQDNLLECLGFLKKKLDTPQRCVPGSKNNYCIIFCPVGVLNVFQAYKWASVNTCAHLGVSGYLMTDGKGLE